MNRSLHFAGRLAVDTAQDAAEPLYDVLDFTANDQLPLEEWLSLPTTAERIAERVELQENAQHYAGIAKKAASPLRRATILPSTGLKLGAHAMAFGVKTEAGENAILKIPRKQVTGKVGTPLNPAERVAFVEERITKCPEIKVANMEKNLAIDYRGHVVTSYVGGRLLDVLRPSELGAVSDEQLAQGVIDLQTMAQARIEHDSYGRNTTYHNQRGFGFFDPLTIDKYSEQECLRRNITGFAVSIANQQQPLFDRSNRRAKLVAQRADIFERLVALDEQAGLSEQAVDVVRGIEYDDIMLWH